MNRCWYSGQICNTFSEVNGPFLRILYNGKKTGVGIKCPFVERVNVCKKQIEWRNSYKSAYFCPYFSNEIIFTQRTVIKAIWNWQIWKKKTTNKFFSYCCSKRGGFLHCVRQPNLHNISLKRNETNNLSSISVRFAWLETFDIIVGYV